MIKRVTCPNCGGEGSLFKGKQKCGECGGAGEVSVDDAPDAMAKALTTIATSQVVIGQALEGIERAQVRLAEDMPNRLDNALASIATSLSVIMRVMENRERAAVTGNPDEGEGAAPGLGRTLPEYTLRYLLFRAKYGQVSEGELVEELERRLTESWREGRKNGFLAGYAEGAKIT